MVYSHLQLSSALVQRISLELDLGIAEALLCGHKSMVLYLSHTPLEF